MASPTGRTLLEGEFDPRVQRYVRWMVSLILMITVVGIPLIPFWLLFSLNYAPQALDRLSATLTERALEVESGVYFRKESTIPLDRITDIRLHDDPLMRWCGLRGLRVETAGQAGSSASAEGNLVGIVDAEAFRNAILTQREALAAALSGGAIAPVAAPVGDAALLAEIRDLLRSIDSKT